MTREGIRFVLPAGLAHLVERVDGQPVHIGRSPDGEKLVFVSAVSTDTEMRCNPSAEGVHARAFRTEQGLRACSVVGETETAQMAVVVVKLDDVFVAVTALSAGAGAAELAMGVAQSVDIPSRLAAALPRIEVPRPDPRLLGCFEHDGSVRGAVSALMYTQRCFEDDFTFTQKYRFAMSTTYVDRSGTYLDSRHLTDARDKQGTWSYSGGRLHLSYEDGSEAEVGVTFGSDALYIDGKVWKRL